MSQRTTIQGAPYDLRQIEQHLSVDQARAQGALVDIGLRKKFAFALIGLFYTLNLFIVVLVVWLCIRDQNLLDRLLAMDPDVILQIRPNIPIIIDEKIIMTLIGATVVQVGATLVAITQYLFPKRLDN